jgi:signal transduction histidine kinase
MRERVRQVGGSLKIESNACGTSIQVMLPIRADMSAAATGQNDMFFVSGSA